MYSGSSSARRGEPQAVSGDGLHILRAAANVFNKQSQTANKGRSFGLRFGRGATNFSP